MHRSGFQQLLFVAVAHQNYCILPLTNLLAPIYIIVITQSFSMQMQIRIQRHWALVLSSGRFSFAGCCCPSYLQIFSLLSMCKDCNNTWEMTFMVIAVYCDIKRSHKCLLDHMAASNLLFLVIYTASEKQNFSVLISSSTNNGLQSKRKLKGQVQHCFMFM